MSKDGEEIKEIFAIYGRLVYQGQTIEKNLIILSIASNKITKTRYDELFYEKSQLTLGALRKDLEASGRFDTAELDVIDAIIEKRNNLVHHYWWDRAVEFENPELRKSIIDELWLMGSDFDLVEKMLENKSLALFSQYDIDIDALHETMLLEEKTPPMPTFRKLKKEETVTNIVQYNESLTSVTPLFTLEDDTKWVLCESGLSQYKKDIDSKKLIDIPKLKGIFPIRQFNPKPKTKGDWNYELLLKVKNLKIVVSPGGISSDGNDVHFRWTIV